MVFHREFFNRYWHGHLGCLKNISFPTNNCYLECSYKISRTCEATTKHLFPWGHGTISHSVSNFSGISTSHSDSIIWFLYALGVLIRGGCHSISSPWISVSVSLVFGSFSSLKSFSTSRRTWFWKSYLFLGGKNKTSTNYWNKNHK